MTEFHQNKKKIINDPVFGFINLQYEIIYDLIQHPTFQRLRNIKQLGLTYLVFPGANHSRFEHAIGACHLMQQAISVLRLKGHEITEEEAEAVTIAILLHDIGHAPYSHVLENTLVEIPHEEISGLFMRELNKQWNGKLELAIRIFNNSYKKRFLHQLVSSQLDMDRLDYLARDSFFTGVVEGTVGIERIIKMLNVWQDQLVLDVKGIYSVEKFLIARRLMYWQVYLHKTVLSAEFLLINVLRRAQELARQGTDIFCTPTLSVFLHNLVKKEDFTNNILIQDMKILEWYGMLDDSDIITSVKAWQTHSDPVLSKLASHLYNRDLFRTILKTSPPSQKSEDKLLQKITKKITEDQEAARYFLISGEITNSAYNHHSENILVLNKNNKLKDLHEASDINLSTIGKTVRKYYVCYPKELDIN